MSLKPQKNTLQDLLFIIPLSAFFLLYNLGKGSIASWDDAIYAGVAKEIYLSGQWLLLTLGGESWYDKPPLAMWVTVLFYKLFGVNEFSARLFSALAGIGTVLVTYLLGRRLFSRWVGFIGALVLLSSSHFIQFSRRGMLDIPLTFFMTLAFYFFWLGYEKNRYLIFSGIAIGLAVMTKGFAAFLIFPVIWAYCLWAGEFDILTRSSYWIGVMIAVAIALPWHLYEITFHRTMFMQAVVMKHLFVRTTTALDGHTGNYYYYIRTLVNKYHPWILVGIVSAPYFLFKSIKERAGEFIYLTVWMFFVFGVATAIQTKLAWYILPVYPALSLSVGYLVAKLFNEKQNNFIRLMFVAIMVLHVMYSHILTNDYAPQIKGVAPLVKSQLGSNKMIYLYNFHEQHAATFYLEKKSAYLDDIETFVAVAKREKEFSCLIHEKDLEPFKNRLPGLGLSIRGSFQDLLLVQK